jgi:translation elongation factor EF-G
MYVPGPLPLRMTLRSRDFTFGTAYIAEVSNTIAGTSVTCTQAPHTVILNATFEAELLNAYAILSKTFRGLKADPITVAYLQDGASVKEPYFRVMVHTPEDWYGDVVGDLNRRLGLIEGMADSSVGLKIVTVTAPSSELIGYEASLKDKTRDVGRVDYEFLGYDTVWPRPFPPDPKDPAVAKRA